MATYVPGTMEKDQKKLVRSLQQLGPGLDTANANITTNTANITTNTTNIASNTSAITALQTAGTGLTNVAGSLAVSLSKITAALGGNVSLNNASNYFDGPSIAQGSSGLWFVMGTVTITDASSTGQLAAKLWDGTTVIASAESRIVAAGTSMSISLCGYLQSPAGNLRISCKSSSTSSVISFNASGNSLDSAISAIRIG